MRAGEGRSGSQAAKRGRWNRDVCTQILMFEVGFSSTRKFKTPLSSSVATWQLPDPSCVFPDTGKRPILSLPKAMDLYQLLKEQSSQWKTTSLDLDNHMWPNAKSKPLLRNVWSDQARGMPSHTLKTLRSQSHYLREHNPRQLGCGSASLPQGSIWKEEQAWAAVWGPLLMFLKECGGLVKWPLMAEWKIKKPS